MNIAVLIKSVIATDEPIVVRNGKIDEDGVKKVINPYDEYGLEEALRIKEDGGGSVTVISAGDQKTVESLRTALAMGADEALWIRMEGSGAEDEHVLSLALAEAIRQGGFDLVFAGHLSVDNGAGQVAIRVAELLGWPHAGAIVACRVNRDGEEDARKIGQGYTLHVTRDAEGDSENWELPLPALLTAQQGLNEPRYPALAGIMKAKRKPLTELSFSDLLAESEARTLIDRRAGGETASLAGDSVEVRESHAGDSEEVRADLASNSEGVGARRAGDLEEVRADLASNSEGVGARRTGDLEEVRADLVSNSEGVGARRAGDSEEVRAGRASNSEGVGARRAGDLEGVLDGVAVAGPRTERLLCEAPPPRAVGRKLDGTVSEQAAELIALLRNEARILKAR